MVGFTVRGLRQRVRDEDNISYSEFDIKVYIISLWNISM